MENVLEVTESAIKQVADILNSENNGIGAVRISVLSGGCSGFQYGFSIDNKTFEDDWRFVKDGASIVVDSMSLEYLQGATLDYKRQLSGSSFVLSNPNSKSSCGCGKSFSA